MGRLLEQRQETTPPTSQVPGLSPGPDHDRLQAMGDRSVASSLCTGRSRLTPGFLSRSGSPEPMLSATRLMGRCLQPGQESRSCPQRQGTCALMGQSTGRLSHQVLLDQTQPREERTHTSIDCHSSLVHGTVKFFLKILFFRSYRIYQKERYLQRTPPRNKPRGGGRAAPLPTLSLAQGTAASLTPEGFQPTQGQRSVPQQLTTRSSKVSFQRDSLNFSYYISRTTDPAKSPASEVCLSCLHLQGLHAHVRTACSGHWTLVGGRATEAAPAGEQEHLEPLSPPAAPVAPPDSNPAQSCDSTFKTGQLLVSDLNFRISKHPTASMEVGEKHGCGGYFRHGLRRYFCRRAPPTEVMLKTSTIPSSR